MTQPTYRPEPAPGHRLPVRQGPFLVEPGGPKTWVGVLPPRPGFPVAPAVVPPWVPYAGPALPAPDEPPPAAGPEVLPSVVAGVLLFCVFACPAYLVLLGATLA